MELDQKTRWNNMEQYGTIYYGIHQFRETVGLCPDLEIGLGKVV